MAAAKLTPEERFWSRVDKSPGPDACWLWTESVRADGYGNACLRGVSTSAHRIAWMLTFGAIPVQIAGAKKWYVCHHCDNRPCCNPAHLFLGTHADNMADMVAKGRQNPACGERNGSQTHPESRPRGEGQWCARLTADIVREIRARVAAGESQGSVARRFGIHHAHAYRIVKRLVWKHVP